MNHDLMFQKSTQNPIHKSGFISGNDSKTDSRTPNPTLGTIKMVEETLSTIQEYPTKNKLWRALPRQIQYPSLKEILKYLEESNKIMYDKDGTIIWTFANSSQLQKLKESTKPFK